jgi:autotransporter-associated beta strand protein
MSSNFGGAGGNMIAAPISRVVAFAALFAIGTAATPALAQPTSWVDATGSWFNPVNWSNGVPFVGTPLTTVGNGGTALILAPANAGASLLITGGSTVVLLPAGSLTAGGINLGPNGTLLLSGSTFVTGPINLSGGTLRSTIPGTLLTNDITFADSTSSTVAAGAGTTLTLAGTFPTPFLLGNFATAKFGSATDTGTVILDPASPPSVAPTSTIEVAGGTLLIVSGLGASVIEQVASVTVDAGATLANFHGSIRSLLGAGTVQNGGGTITLSGGSSNFAGTISGAGPLALVGATATLTGTNTYTGGTTIDAASTLQLGNGGATGSIIGDVVDNGVFQVNRSDVFTFGGVISGTGSFAQAGSGTTILTANNTYSGGTTIAAGTLAVGADNNLGTAAGGITFTGAGTLQFLSSFTTGRAVTLNAIGTFDTQANTDALAGVISGPGGLTKVGSGILSLNAGNTYSGPTAVNAGTLQTGVANALSTATAVTVASGATFNLNSFHQSIGSLAGGGNVALGAANLTTGNDGTSTTFSGAIGGTGGLTKVGGGAFTLTGASTYTGPTNVNAGTLFVNGSIANSAVTVNSGGTLAGFGTVGATTINSGGTFAPGNSPGTMTVQGNLAFQSGALYLVQVDPSTASSTNVIAGGSAALAGTVNAAFAAGSYMSRTYTILSAAGGLNGTTFNNLTTTNLPAGFIASLSYTATNAILNLTAALGQPAAPGVPGVPGVPGAPSGPNALGPGALSFNQFNVANSLNNFFNNGGALPPSFVTIFGLTGGNLANALSQLSGEAATGAQKVGFQLTDQFLTLMLDPFVDGRSGVGGADHPALGFAPEREELPEDIALAYAKILKAPPKPAPIYEPRWTVWGAGFGGSNRTSGDLAVIGSHDLSARTAGGAAGLDYRLTPDTVVGFAFAGAGTDWSLSQGLGGGKSDAFQAGLYGATKSGPAYLAAAFAFTNHWMSTDRFAVGDHLTANFNAQSYGGRLEGGYRFGMPYGGITPYAAIQAQNFHTPGYTETGLIPSGFALAFGSRDATDTRSELGARFDRVLAIYTNAVLALRGRVAWAHDWVSDPSLVPVFQTLPGASFIVNGATLAKNSALTSAGAELRLANGVALLAKFDGEFASHSSTYAGTGTLRYRW